MVDRSLAGTRDGRPPGEAEQALRLIAGDVDRLRQVLDGLPIGVVLISPQLLVQFCNAQCESVFGWSADEVLGRHICATFAQGLDAEVERIRGLLAPWVPVGGRNELRTATAITARGGSVLDCSIWGWASAPASRCCWASRHAGCRCAPWCCRCRRRSRASPTQGGSLPSILCIEADPSHARLMRELLGTLSGNEIHVACKGRDGVALALALKPVLALVHIRLLDISGFEVVRQLRANPATASLRFVAVAADASDANRQRAPEAGFDEFWPKPLHLGHTLERLRHWLVPTEPQAVSTHED